MRNSLFFFKFWMTSFFLLITSIVSDCVLRHFFLPNDCFVEFSAMNAGERMLGEFDSHIYRSYLYAQKEQAIIYLTSFY